MKLEHFGMAEPGDCRLVFTADAEELERAITAEQAAPDAPQAEEDLLTAAVNRTILEGFSALYEQIAAEYGVTPVTDPDFELLAVNRAEGFRAGAQFYALPPLTLGRYTGFVQAVEPHLIRQLTIEMEINRHHGDEERAADAAGKAALRQRVARELYAQRCVQAKARAEKEVIWQLGDEVTGPLPKQLVGGNYFAEQRQFNLSLQANGINFDQFLKVRGQTVEEFRTWLHTQAERKLRSWLGLLLVAEAEGLQPTETEVTAALTDWNEKLDGERTFPANDARKVRQRLMRAKATAFVLEHSTLTPPPLLAQGIALCIRPLLQSYLAISMACCIHAQTGLPEACRMSGQLLRKSISAGGKLFALLLGVQRVITLQLDHTTSRLGQMLTGSVPVIGQALSGAADTVLAGLQLLKNSLGIAALVILGAEFVPLYLGLLFHLAVLSGCRLLCSFAGIDRCQALFACLTEAVRCMAAVTALFFSLTMVGVALMTMMNGG